MFICIIYAITVESCTTIIGGKRSTSDGSTFVTHNNDCTDCDIRLGLVPSTHNRDNNSLTVNTCKFTYPRYIGSDRGTTYTYDHSSLEHIHNDYLLESTVLSVLENESLYDTYSYIDGTYGIANEKQLAIGESTCSARLISYAYPIGDALFDISTLTRVALAHCDTARCAIKKMGYLAVTYGYYGANDPPESDSAGLYEESGEALTIIDKSEAWVYHILPDNTGKSAVWAAQRLHDHHVAVVANKFIIRHINFSDSEYFLYSDNIIDVAYNNGFINSRDKDSFDFTAAYAPDGNEIASTTGGWNDRRTWRVFDLVNPSAQWSPVSSEVYPFSVHVDSRLSHTQIFAMNRDHFENTDYDLTQGTASGPYHTPTRYDRNTDPRYQSGYFERAISLHRTTYSFVAQSREWLDDRIGGILWFAHHSPHTSLFVPLYTATTRLPSTYTRGTIFQLSRDSAWWSYAAVSNYCEKQYMYIHLDIEEQQYRYENDAVVITHTIDKQANELLSNDKNHNIKQLITEFTVNNGDTATRRWWQLLDYLMTKYRDGQRMVAFEPPVRALPLFYPVQWLQQTLYYANGALPVAGIKLPAAPSPPHPDNHIDTQSLDTIAASHVHGNSFQSFIQLLEQSHDTHHSNKRHLKQQKLVDLAGNHSISTAHQPIHPSLSYRYYSIDAELISQQLIESQYTHNHQFTTNHLHHTTSINTIIACVVVSTISFVIGMRYQRSKDYIYIG